MRQMRSNVCSLLRTILSYNYDPERSMTAAVRPAGRDALQKCLINSNVPTSAPPSIHQLFYPVVFQV